MPASPKRLRMRRPSRASNSARRARTRKVTSRPASRSLPPKYPPTAPAPTTRVRIVLSPREDSDPPARSDGPPGATGHEADGVEIPGIEGAPGLAAIGRSIRTRSACHDPGVVFRQVSGGGAESGGAPVGRQGPRLSAIGRQGKIARVLRGFGIVAADRDAVPLIEEVERENTGAGTIVAHRSAMDAPGAAAVARVKDTRAGRAAGAEPDFARADHGERGVAGGEGPFAGQGGRRGAALPMRPGIVRGQDDKLAVHRVAESDAVFRVPERQPIQKAF